METDSPPALPSRSWSIYDRPDVTARYEVLERVGSGAYADVYRARRRSDCRAVALKEVHDAQSAIREVAALEALRGTPNVVELFECFLGGDKDAVLALEFLPVDLASVIRNGRRWSGGVPAGEAKRWMVQILRGVDACHRSSVVHRDLKPSNLMISTDGVLKIVDFGQARILQEARPVSRDVNSNDQLLENEAWIPQQPAVAQEENKSWFDGSENQKINEPAPIYEDEYLQQIVGLKAKCAADDTDREISLQDGNVSCVATCSTGDIEDDLFKNSYSYELDMVGPEDESGALTSCVGTRWFRAPELLYGSTSYGQEVDLWSLGCIFAELLSLQTLFSGSSDIDQIGKIIKVLGDLNEETWPGCSKLPDYSKILFSKIGYPVGLEACLPNRSAAEVNLIKRLVCYDPASRATAMELLHNRYFEEAPLPVPVNELTIPSSKDARMRALHDDEVITEAWE